MVFLGSPRCSICRDRVGIPVYSVFVSEAANFRFHSAKAFERTMRCKCEILNTEGFGSGSSVASPAIISACSLPGTFEWPGTHSTLMDEPVNVSSSQRFQIAAVVVWPPVGPRL